MKIEALEPKYKGPGRPRLKIFLSENCLSTHFVPMSLWKIFLDHYYGSYEHLIKHQIRQKVEETVRDFLD